MWCAAAAPIHRLRVGAPRRSLTRRQSEQGRPGGVDGQHPALAVVAAALLTGSVGVHIQAPATLDIYWIDVEGGAATLVVTPGRDAILMDTGWPRADARDAGRIRAAMRDADITQIDYLLVSHFHRDHVGGLAALAEQVPIGQIIDHGETRTL